MDIEALARRIKELRISSRLTRNQVDSRSELAHSYTSRLERGLIRNPGILQLQRIADALGVTLSSLVAASEEVSAAVEGAPDPVLRTLTSNLADIASDLSAIRRIDPERLEVVRRVVADIRGQAETEVRRRRRVMGPSTRRSRTHSSG